MSNILLIEPEYKCKQPPLGLMKISYFHKNILHDYVRFTKGPLPASLSKTKWDHVYVTTLFTFEWDLTIKAIEYAKTLVDDISKITVGGIAATLMPDDFYQATGIRPVCGLLNVPGKLGLPGDECIDQIVPDYSMLDDIDYIYPFNNAYFLSATKGCGNNCGFCAVQTLEPKFIPYINIKDKIKAIDENYGTKKDLILMDNNVLRSPRFNDIIDDILEAGFERGATYVNPKTGKKVQRIIDFNQGLDALFLTEEKAKRLGEIALSPARIAFDHIEDRGRYEKAMRLCAKYGITELSNYVLYNSEDFGGKGQHYHADTPEDLYERMRITLDLTDDINRNLPEGSPRVASFSFPMRYIPLNAHERGYIGSQWNAKYLRAVQKMLVPTQGKGVSHRSFFEADFGHSPEEFVSFLSMPERLIGGRGEISKIAKGKQHESPEEYAVRKAAWDRDQVKIAEWTKLYNELGDQKPDFVELISDNRYLPEKTLSITSPLLKKIYLHYLTTPRLVALLGMIDKHSPTYSLIKEYISEECPALYDDILDLVTSSEQQQNYIFKNFISFYGKVGIQDVINRLSSIDYSCEKLLAKWNKCAKELGIGYIDFELIGVYRRYIDAGCLNNEEHIKAKMAISNLDMPALALVLDEKLPAFQLAMDEAIEEEKGKQLLKKVVMSITENIQIKLSSFLGD